MVGKKSVNRFRFTKQKIDSLPLPEGSKRDNWYDETRPELALRVTSSGSKSFYIVRRIANSSQPSWVRLGSYPSMTIEQARNEAAKILSEMLSGVNPTSVKRNLRGELTVDEFFHGEFWERHASLKDTARDDKQRYEKHIKPVIGKKRLSEVTDDDAKRIEKRMREQGKTAPSKDDKVLEKTLSGTTINRVKSLLNVMYERARAWKLCEIENPAKAINKTREKARDRYLRGDEFERFFNALAQESDSWRDYFLVQLFMGQRRNNGLSMKWSELNFVDGLWHIPDTKNGEPQILPIPKSVLELLKKRKERRKDESDYVFPGDGKTGHLVEPKNAWARILARAEIEGLWIHDLRRTLGSSMAGSNVALHTIGKALGHKSIKSTMVYVRLAFDPVRSAMATSEERMLGMLGKEKL